MWALEFKQLSWSVTSFQEHFVAAITVGLEVAFWIATVNLLVLYWRLVISISSGHYSFFNRDFLHFSYAIVNFNSFSRHLLCQ
jgi:hypothetical protein